LLCDDDFVKVEDYQPVIIYIAILLYINYIAVIIYIIFIFIQPVNLYHFYILQCTAISSAGIHSEYSS